MNLILIILSFTSTYLFYKYNTILKVKFESHKFLQDQCNERIKKRENYKQINPNRCEECLGNHQIPSQKYDVSDTGRCGCCLEVNDVWDIEHLTQTGKNRKNNGSFLRNSHVLDLSIFL
jgi:hypothetical protein